MKQALSFRSAGKDDSRKNTRDDHNHKMASLQKAAARRETKVKARPGPIQIKVHLENE
jgi:hypothetical protein